MTASGSGLVNWIIQYTWNALLWWDLLVLWVFTNMVVVYLPSITIHSGPYLSVGSMDERHRSRWLSIGTKGVLANLECLETQIRYVHCGYILEAILSDDDGYQLAILGHIEAGDVVVIATITVDSEMSHIRWNGEEGVSIVYSVFHSRYIAYIYFHYWMIVRSCIRGRSIRPLHSHNHS
mgnify:CR=1 FL=1